MAGFADATSLSTSFDATGLAPGDYLLSLTVVDDEDNDVTQQVLLTVEAGEVVSFTPVRPANPTVSVFVTNLDGERVGQIANFSELSATVRFNEPGRWSLTAPVSPAKGLIDQPGAGILVYRDGDLFLSGPMIETVESGDGTMVSSGSDDGQWLADKLALVASGDSTTYGPDPTETIMRELVADHAGSLADAARRNPEIVEGVTSGLGATLTKQAKKEPVADLLKQWADEGGLGWRVYWDNEQRLLDVFEPADLTGQVFLSEGFGTIADWSVSRKRPEATFALALGAGDGASRAEGEFASDPDGWGRIERATVDDNTSDSTELDSKAEGDLARWGSSSLTFPIVTRETAGTRFGRDFGLGDEVTVRVSDYATSDVVVEATLTGDGQVSVQVGGRARRFIDLADQLRDLRARVDRQDVSR